MDLEAFRKHITARRAGSCPRRQQLESTLRSCHDQAALIAVKHDSYLHFIDDLKNDLDSLSCQVNVAQHQLNAEEGACSVGGGGDGRHVGNCEGAAAAADATSEGSLCRDCTAEQERWEREFEQIDAKQRCLEELDRQIAEFTRQHNDADFYGVDFQNQIEVLQRTISGKEKHIKQLNSMLERLSEACQQSQSPEQSSEGQRDSRNRQQQDEELEQLRAFATELQNRNESLMQDLRRSQKQEVSLRSELQKLREELLEMKHKNGDINTHACRLTGLLQTQEKRHSELSRKYRKLEESHEHQAQQLQAVGSQLCQLQERHQKMEQRTDEHNMERQLLREEVLALKEKEAVLLGRQKSVQEQMVKIDKELQRAQDVIREQQSCIQRKDKSHAEVVQRMAAAGKNTKLQFNGLVDDYNRLQQEYEKQIDVQKQNQKVIDSFRKWKEAQLRSDEATRASFKQYEDHIKMLLEEKQKFLEKYRELKHDYCVMQKEVDSMRSRNTFSVVTSRNVSDNSIENRIEHIRRTSRRLSERSASHKDDGSSSDGPVTQRHGSELPRC